MTYIKILTALTALALLTACGSPTVNIGEVNINNGALCDTNPYGANCGEEFETPRQTIASGCRTDDSGALCDDATTFVCDKNFDDMLCDDITEYVDQREVVMEQCTDTKTQAACDEEDRITACDANEFASDCAEQKYVDKRRMTCTSDKTSTRCMPTVDLICGADGDIFDDFCTGLTDTDTMRANACQTHGTDAGGDDSCAASLASSCTITDPFIYAGCKDVEGIAGVRMMYCETPATAWNPKCMETTHGAVNTTRVTACQMFGTDTGMGGDDSCATSLAIVCNDIANPFIYEGCDDVAGINAGVRKIFCETPATAWNPKCMDTTHGAVDATRVTACEMFGTDTDMGGDTSCATSLISVCLLANPFIHAGCDDVVGINAGVRTMFCEMPANAWNPKCMETTHGTVSATRVTACQMFGTDTGMGGDDSCATSLISVCLLANPFIHAGCDDVAGIDDGVRTMFCEMPANAWNPKCMQTTHGAVNATRVMACEMFGTDTGMGGDDSCATSLASSCTITNPFIHEGCDDVVGIDAGVRTMFCEMPANAWNPKCMDTTHGTVIATRMTACQMFGTGMGGDTSCADSLASSCTITNPFIHAGCDDVTDIDSGVRTMFCEMPANAWNPKCMDTTHGTVNATRMTACEMFGTGMGGDDSCATSLISVCLLANPFIHAGCDDVAGIDAGVRTMFCEMPANAWNPKCMDTTHGTVIATRMTACQMFGTGMGGDTSCATSLISVCLLANPFIHEGCDDIVGIDAGVRKIFCETPATAWNPKCMDTTHGAVDATRVTACEMFGTNTDTGGDDSCANSLISVCLLANPFIHEGCDDVVGINAGVRTMFCEMPANAWNPKCMDTTHGTVNATRMTACEMFGTDTGMGGDDSCATSLISVCLLANPFIHAGCDDVAGIDDGVRTMFCEMPANAWNPKCMETTHGTVNATRMTACEMFGTDTNMGGDTSCATSLISVCLIANPFAHAGCDDVTDIDSGVRTMFCEMPANAWNPKCMDTTHGAVTTTRMTACEMFGTGMGGDDSCATSLISVCLLANPFIHEGCNDVVGIDAGLRKTFCETPANAWNPKCMDTTHGAVNATRVTACQMFGTGTGGDNSCATSLASVCNDIANPFIHAGCDDVAGIDAGVRTMYCQMSANAWNPKCMDTTHGTVTATRGDACLEFGTDTTKGGHRSCVSNTLAESSCASNPFDSANPGCAILTKFEMIVRTYCKASHVTGCPTATYDAWVASFPDNAPLLASNLAPTAGNKFLQGKETGLNTTGLGDFTADSFNFQTATYNGMLFGGSATNGVAFQYGNIGGKRYFYAGLLSGTDLGPPLTEAVTNATWYGRIVVLQNRDWYLTRAGKIYGDIDLTVNYDGDNNGTIRGSYDEYTVNGTFDSKGIMGGNVTRSKIDTYTRRTFIGDSNATTTTTYSFQRRVVGPLTGLIGQTEAVGVFIGQDFTNYDDKPRQVDANLNNFKHPATRAGFAGGFIARSTRP